MIVWLRRVADLLALLLMVGLAWFGVGRVYAAHREVVYTVDALPVLLPLDGFHALEPLVDREGVFRWTRGVGVVQLPNPGGQALLRLSMSSGLDNATPAQVRVGAARYDFTVGPGLRIYAFQLPPQPGERLAVTISSPTIEADGRTLGVVLQRLLIASDGGLPARVPLALAAAALGGYLLLRRAGLATLIAGPIILVLELGALAWQAGVGWRYGLFEPLLFALGGASLLAVAVEQLWPPLRPAPPPLPQLERADYRAIAGLLLLALAICLPWLAAPDPVGDLELSARRMWFMAQAGLAEANSRGGDYMPLRIYILRLFSLLLRPLGEFYFWDPLPTPTLLLIKLPSLLANLGTVALIYLWGKGSLGRRGAFMLAGLHALVPPVWINVAWWGQVDAFLTFPMLLAVALFDRAGGRWSWLCWALALLIKPQAIILAPLIYIVTLRRHGCRGLAQGGAIAGGLLLAAITPLALAGQGVGLYQAAAGSVGRFPQATNRAYNLWQLVTGGASISDETLWLGGISYHDTGLALLAVAVLLICLALLRRSDGYGRAGAAAALAMAFFSLPTQIHERYAFFALPFLALWVAGDRLALLPYLVLAVTSTINIFGAIASFAPPLQRAITASPLPSVVAVVNLVVLVWMLVRLVAHALNEAKQLPPVPVPQLKTGR